METSDIRVEALRLAIDAIAKGIAPPGNGVALAAEYASFLATGDAWVYQRTWSLTSDGEMRSKSAPEQAKTV
jgi:hypothetical protein